MDSLSVSSVGRRTRWQFRKGQQCAFHWHHQLHRIPEDMLSRAKASHFRYPHVDAMEEVVRIGASHLSPRKLSWLARSATSYNLGPRDVHECACTVWLEANMVHNGLDRYISSSYDKGVTRRSMRITSLSVGILYMLDRSRRPPSSSEAF